MNRTVKDLKAKLRAIDALLDRLPEETYVLTATTGRHERSQILIDSACMSAVADALGGEMTERTVDSDALEQKLTVCDVDIYTYSFTRKEQEK